jgi:hypothetical protein
MTETVAQDAGLVLPTAMPSFKNKGVLSKDQMTTFIAIAEAIIPGIVPDTTQPAPNQISIPVKEYEAVLAEVSKLVGPDNHAAVERMLSEGVTSIPDFRDVIDRVFNLYTGEVNNVDIRLITNLLK